MTIHAAKGLEFNTVFLPGWEEGIFPNDKTTKEGDLEEERRLAYVAITRARVRAIITNAMVRSVFGQRQYQSESRFINEIDKQFMNIQGHSYSQPQQSYSKPAKPKQLKSESVVGKMVVHAEMGSGVVIAENDNILTVAFKTKGIKNVARDFLRFV